MFFRRRKHETPTFEQRLESLRKQGFAVESLAGAPARVKVSKDCCAAMIEPVGASGVVFVEKPGIVMDGEISRLLDGGYQKFLVTRGKGRQPALAGQLRAIHQFSEELRQGLCVPSLYNESLGTVSNLYRYDRLEGRE